MQTPIQQSCKLSLNYDKVKCAGNILNEIRQTTNEYLERKPIQPNQLTLAVMN